MFTKPPSAELAPGQEDEKSLGIDYATLDKILIAQVEQGLSTRESAVAAGVSEVLAARVAHTVASYAFKRAQEPPFPEAEFYK